jgi:hypothetical protein
MRERERDVCGAHRRSIFLLSSEDDGGGGRIVGGYLAWKRAMQASRVFDKRDHLRE